MRFLLISALVLVAAAADPPQQTLSQQICRTALFTKQGSGGTSTIATTLYYTRTITSTTTPTKTVTPSSTTVVTKSTSTKSVNKTLPQTTNTFSQTLSFSVTSTAYTTLIATSTSWATVTATSTYDTLTVSASSGFVPLSSALAASGHAVAKKARRGSVHLARDAEPEADAKFDFKKQANTQKIICGSDGSISYDPPIFRGTVTCYKRVTIVSTKVVSVAARSTKTITAPRGTVTSTSVSTTTKTVTETPVAASTTLTFSTTLTLSTTSTIISTTTSSLTTTTTVYAAQPTFYAACANSNIVSFVDNQRIYSIATTDPDNGFSFGSSTTSAYDCCVQCANTGSCGGSTFHPASGTCYFFPVVSAGTCVATSQSGTFARQSGTNLGFVVSNSNCGELELAA